MQQARRQASIVAADLNDVVLVGGCSHMPGVKRALVSVFHIDPIAPDPEAAAARGAAMQAQPALQSPALGFPERCMAVCSASIANPTLSAGTVAAHSVHDSS